MPEDMGEDLGCRMQEKTDQKVALRKLPPGYTSGTGLSSQMHPEPLTWGH